MEKEFVKLWEENKESVKEWISNVEDQSELDYGDFVENLFKICFDEWDSSEITELDHGDYQGTKVWLIHRKTYQPCETDYVWTTDYYGSCSGCDTLQAISDYDNGKPNEEQVKDYMGLMLNLVQKIKYLSKD